MTLTYEKDFGDRESEQILKFRSQVNGKPLIYFDKCCQFTETQICDRCMKYYYEHDNANVHRGAHTLSARATDA
jgi:cysteine desulfurase/selenocysteine lyase